MAKKNVISGSAPILWSTVDQAFRNINDNFNELYASLDPFGGPIDFTNLGTSLNPVSTEQFDLGTSSNKWKQLFVSGTYGITIGSAQIVSNGVGVDIPAGSTIDGSFLDQEYFREIAVAGQSNIVADAGGNAVLTVASGNSPGISITTNPATDTLTITNSGVTQLSGTAGQIGVSSSTGAVTLTNLGVLSLSGIGLKDPSLAAGSGIHVSSSTGNITVTNTGILQVTTYTGSGIIVNTLSPGVVELVNSAPNIPQDAIRNLAVSGQDTIIASGTNYTLTVVEGNSGITLTTNLGAGRLTITNSGVTGITTSGPGISASASTGNINIAFTNEIDIVGSVFSDSSTMLVDGTGGRIVGPVYTSTLRTSETEIRLGAMPDFEDPTGGPASNTVAVGAFAGEIRQDTNAIAIGYIAANEDQGDHAIAVGVNSGGQRQASYAAAFGVEAGYRDQGVRALAVGYQAGAFNQGQEAVAIGKGAGHTNQPANSIIINASGIDLNGSAAGLFVSPIRSLTNPATVLGYNTSTKEISYSSLIDVDVVGSVFSDSSTMLVDGTNGAIVGPVSTSSLRTSETNIALGAQAGQTNQGASTIAIGGLAGNSNQGTSAVAIGGLAGTTNQGVSTVAVGALAGNSGQGAAATAVGALAGSTNQGAGAVAVGSTAGSTDQGANAIAIGALAGSANQPANSIVLNASGTGLNGSAAGFFVDPIRNLSTGNILTYNTATKEIGYTSLIETDISGSVFADDSTKIIDGTDGTVTATTVTAGGVIGTNYLRAPVYTNATARDAALPTGVVATGMIIFLQSTSKLQVNANGTTGGWVDLN
jgi:hypothetical protein